MDQYQYIITQIKCNMKTFLEKHWLTLSLFVVVLCMGAYHTKAIQREQADKNAQTAALVNQNKAIDSTVAKIEIKLAEVKITTTADSIAQIEEVKKLGKPYTPNMKHLRLIAIRDSLRKCQCQ